MALTKEQVSSNIIKGIRWFFGIVFLISAASEIKTSVFSAAAATALTAMLIPPLAEIVYSKIKVKVPAWGKLLIGIFLFFFMISNFPTNNTVSSAQTNEAADSISAVTQPVAENIQASPQALAMAVPNNNEQAEITKVIDGDTVQVKGADGKSKTLRLIGIDTPESVDPRKPVQCFATEATKKAKELLPIGKNVLLESDSSQGDKDKYYRELRYIFLEGGTNFNRLMIAEGYAKEYTYQNPYKYTDEFKAAEKQAIAQKLGLWADDACVAVTTPPPTPKPTSTNMQLTPVQSVKPSSTGGYTCGGKTKCGEMATCAEAEYYLNTCGLSRLDGDHDGVPCESLCN